MRAVRYCGLAVLASALAAATAGAAVPPQSAGECFKAAFEANDADALGTCYAEDAIMWFPGGSMARGRQAIRDGFAHFLAGMRVDGIEMVELGHEALGDARVAWGTYTIRVTDRASNASMTQSGRFTDVQRKIGGAGCTRSTILRTIRPRRPERSRFTSQVAC